VMVKRKHSVKAKKQFETIANDLNSQLWVITGNTT
jgi:hypothetical protein